MENRFERRAEAGGEKKAEKSEQSQTWRERFWERLNRRNEESGSEKETKKEVGFSEFVKGIFKRDEQEGAEKQERESWIDEVFAERDHARSQEERLAEVPEQERQEFYMEVAQRFKDAGERFMTFVRGLGPETVQERISQDGELTAQIDNVKAMYDAEDYEQDLSHVPELKIPKEDAPPFDFAVDQQPVARMHHRPDNRDIIYYIDDFDYPTQRTTEAPRVNRTDGMTTVEYKPRLRDVLFAGSIGAATGHEKVRLNKVKQEAERKRKKTERKLEDRIKKDEQEFREARMRLVREQRQIKEEVRELKRENREFEEENEQLVREAEAPQPQQVERSGAEVMETVRQAAEAIMDTSKEPLIPKELQADPVKAAERLARAEAASVKELEFEKLKPSNVESDRSEWVTAKKRPDSIRVATMKAMEQEPVVVESVPSADRFEAMINERERQERVERIEEREIVREQRVEAKDQASKMSAAYGDAVSVSDVLANRTRVPGESRATRQQMANQYGMQTQRPTQSWAATAVIIGLAVIGLVFIVAL